MERNDNRDHRSLLLSICVVLFVTLVLLIIMLVFMRDGKKPSKPSVGQSTTTVSVSEGSMPDLTVLGIEEEDGMMVVTTSYFVIKYPSAFSDLIQFKTETFEDYAQMDFSVVISGEETLLYSLICNKNTGFPVGTLQLNDSDYTVTAEIYDLEHVSDEDRLTCQAAQETFNDVMMSLTENKGFTTE